MEIQFSIPLKPGRAPTAVDSSAPAAATVRSAGAAVARGGTHRFALESRTRHTRKSSTRARTGCSTCKKRHVKCDETKPSCQNCLKWRGYCDGYTDPDARSTRREPPALAKNTSKQTSNPPGAPSSTALTNLTKTKPVRSPAAPALLTEPAVNTIHFTTAEERLYFDEWSLLSVSYLGGSLVQSRLWTTTMPQLTLQEPTLRYGAMAVGALRKACERETEAEPNNPTAGPMNSNAHYLNAIIYYCEALRLQSKARPSREGLRTAMLSSLLFICFEAQRGNMPAALKHVTHGFTMLNELAACTDMAPHLVSIAPAPPALVQEILECYKPLELQSRSFMGSYRKVFFPPRKQTPSANPQQAPQAPMVTPTRAQAQSPQSQHGSPWQAPQTNPQVSTGLPSPQSQASPRNQSDPTPPRAPPSRPPGIAPFTKHSPYFRPKQSNITNLDGLPLAFTTFDEAHGYWALLQRRMVQYIPLLTATTAQLALAKIVDIRDVETKLASVKQNPKIANFIDESRQWLQRWSTSFAPLLQAATLGRTSHPTPYLQALNLRIEYLILYIYTSIPRFSSLATAQALTPYYIELNAIAEMLIASRPNCGFAMDAGWTWPLFVSAFGCRDASVKEDAIRILGKYPVRNALRDSRVFRAIALKNGDVERSNMCEGTEDEQWLRLRRRELVFEDLGTNIIFRSVQKNPVTGEWELVEEVASFIVAADGLLEWHRQPISESASILSGVC